MDFEEWQQTDEGQKAINTAFETDFLDSKTPYPEYLAVAADWIYKNFYGAGGFGVSRNPYRKEFTDMFNAYWDEDPNGLIYDAYENRDSE